ncbi:MAG: RlmE family RNA methyltransferase [Oligoflexia bacterium]|nr:RlmE family RNA methyltransferase [Oligoflexia bacterium]
MAEYNRKDHLYNKAKAEGFRSRAAYKLAELDDKYKIIKPGFKILDLGCWPGGWIQVAAPRVGAQGAVVGIDLVELEPFDEFPQVKLLVGDARDESNQAQMRSLAGGAFDAVLSDMSPKLTGIKEADQAGTVACAELAAYIAEQMLRKGGTLVMKVFKGNETEQFIRTLRPRYEKLTRTELDSSRNTSKEFYVTALGYKGSGPAT